MLVTPASSFITFDNTKMILSWQSNFETDYGIYTIDIVGSVTNSL